MEHADQEQAGRPGWYAQFVAAVKALKAEVTALYYAMQDPRTPWYATIIPFIAIGYAVSPLDLIPDFIPILGLLDDLIILPALIYLAILALPSQVMEDARARAKAEPIRLGRNWALATFFFLLWLGLLSWGVFTLCTKLAPQYGGDELAPWAVHITAGAALLATGAFIWWLVGAVRKERLKQAKVKAAVLASPDLEAAELTEPLLAT